MPDDGLRRDDVVEVRTPAEILATLDDQGLLDGLPFMPEMIRFCGQRFVVDRRADKICDTIYYSGSRRLPDTVMLEDLRCDGSGHDGCQAECRLFWKEAWLRPPGSAGPLAPTADPAAEATLRRLAEANARQTNSDESLLAGTYRCQATELFRASLGLVSFDPRPYVHEYTTGNVGLTRLLRVVARAAIDKPLRKLGIGRVPLAGTRKKGAREQALNLQPGELAQVKPRDQIAATLTPDGKHRGLWFDAEMLPFCGKTYRVRQRIKRFIDEGTGNMIELKNDCVTLDGVVCSGDRSWGRYLCPRAIYPYWREAWLQRVEAPPTGPAAVPEQASPSA